MTTGSPGGLDAFAPNAKKIHIDIDPSSINKNVRVDIPIIGDVGHILEDMIKIWKSTQATPDKAALKAWWNQIEEWRKKDSLKFDTTSELIKPQYAISRLYKHSKGRDTFITTEVGQHQMWAAQHFGFREAESLDDLGRARHHGLRSARGDRCASGAPGCAGGRHFGRSVDS